MPASCPPPEKEFPALAAWCLVEKIDLVIVGTCGNCLSSSLLLSLLSAPLSPSPLTPHVRQDIQQCANGVASTSTLHATLRLRHVFHPTLLTGYLYQHSNLVPRSPSVTFLTTLFSLSNKKRIQKRKSARALMLTRSTLGYSRCPFDRGELQTTHPATTTTTLTN